MYHRHISELSKLTKEIIYLDEITFEERVGIVLKIEQLHPNLAFVYVASTRKEDNDKIEGNLQYRDIIVFDDKPNEIEWIYKDPVIGEFNNFIEKENLNDNEGD